MRQTSDGGQVTVVVDWSGPAGGAVFDVTLDTHSVDLDSKIGHEIMRLLRRIAKEQGRSVVIVSHDQRIRDIADRVLWLEDGAFKDIVTMATDPVCGMAVERERAVSAERDGETYFFCSRGCREEFLGALAGPSGDAQHGLRRVPHVESG